MSSVPNSGVISFGNMRSILGKSTGIVRMSDVRQTQANVPTSGTLRAAHFKGMGSTKGTFQTFGDDVQNACTGIYSVRLLNTSYTGPVVNVMRTSDNTIADFWADYNGNLRTGQGQTYTEWLGTSSATIAYVLVWYDQSGYGRDAIGTTQCGAIPPQFSPDPTILSTKYSIQYQNRYDPIIVVSPYYIYPAYNSTGATAPTLLPNAGYVAFAPGSGVLSNSASCQYLNFGSVTFNMASGFSSTCTFMFRMVSANERIYDFGAGEANSNIMLWRSGTSNNLNFHVYNGTSIVFGHAPNSSFLINTIYHLTIVYNPSVGSTGRVYMYVNGILDRDIAPTSALTNRTVANSWVGRSNWNSDNASNINIYSLHIWNKVLSPAEITERAAAASYLTMQTQLIYVHPHLQSPSYNSTGGTAPTLNTASGQLDFLPGNVASNSASARVMNFGSQTFTIGTTGFSAAFAFQYRGVTQNLSERILDFGNGGPGNNIFVGRYAATNTFTFTVYEAGTAYDCITTGFSFLQNTMYEVACVYDPNVGTTGCMYIYVDGILRQSLVSSVKFTDRTLTNTYVGRSNWAPDIAFNGVIHFLHVYNRAITPQEVWTASRVCDVIPYSGFNIFPAITDQTLSLSWRGVYGPNTVNSSNGTPPTLDVANRWFVFSPGNAIASNSAACQYYDFGSVYFPCASQGFTISIEFMYTLFSTGNGWERLFDFGSGAGVDNLLLSRDGTTTNLRFDVRNGGTVVNPSTLYITTTLAINTWYKVVIVYNPVVGSTGTVYAYLNDSLVTSQAPTAQLTNRTMTRNFIARSSFDVDNAFNGYIRTFNWWNRVLTPAEFSTSSASAMLSYRMRDNLTTVNATRSQDIISSLANVSLRSVNNQITSTGGANDFMNGASGFGYNNATYASATPFTTVTLNSWNTLCASRSSGKTIFNQIGFMPPAAFASAVTGAFNGFMNDIVTFSSALPTVTSAVGTSSPDYVMFMKNAHIPSWRNGLYGAFFAENWQGTGGTYAWVDQSGYGNHLSTVYGTVSSNNAIVDVGGGAGTSILSGGTTAGLEFTQTILPSTYTMLHLAKYNGATRRRIVQQTAATTNFHSGHWGGLSGVAFHGGQWITQSSSDLHKNAWVLSTDQNSLYRSLAASRYNGVTPGNPSNTTQLRVNDTSGGESSDWALACIMVYNRTLTLTEYLILEDYLANRYRIPIPIQEGLILSLDASDYVSGAATWNDRSGNGYNFTIQNTASYVGTAQVPHFAFTSSLAYRAANVPFATYNTLIAFTCPQTSTADWRTMVRGLSFDHYVLVASGTNNLGTYDSNADVFIPYDNNINITTLPNVFTRMNMWVFHISSVAPYYVFYYNPSSLPLTPTGVIASDARAAINNGFAQVGGCTPSARQPWGNIGTFLWYNRKLSEQEIVETYWRYQAKYAGVVQSSLQVCYAMRLKVETYTGPIIRIRRSTDNLQQDFFSDETQTFLTTSAYNTGQSYDDWIVGGATGYATIWYDQSGNGNNLTNTANNTTQPTLSKQNNRWVLSFTPSLSTVLNLQTNIQPFTVIAHMFNTQNTLDGSRFSTLITAPVDFSFRIADTSFTGTVDTYYGNATGTKLAYVNGAVSTSIANNAWNYMATSVQTPQWPSGTSFNRVGAGGSGTTRGFSGSIAELICHNTQIQVQDLQNYYSARMFLMNPLTKPRYGLVSPAAANSARGIYACWRVQENYTGPVMAIRRGSDNTTANFYDDGNGSMVTATGIHVSRWLSGASAFVTIWYDQSGQDRHATQTTVASQPVYNPVTKNIVFDGSNDCFALPNNTIPSGNTSYTVLARHDFVDNSSQICGFISAGTNVNNQAFSLHLSNVAIAGYQHIWWANDLNSGAYVKGNVVTAHYDNAVGKTTFINGVQTGSQGGTARNTLSTNNFIGVLQFQGSTNLKGELKCIYVFSSALSDTDRTIIENSNVWMPYNALLYTPPNFYGLSLYLDASRTESYPGTGTTWTDLSGSGNHVTLSNTTFNSTLSTLTFNGTTSSGYRATYNMPPTTQMAAIAWVYIRGGYDGTFFTLGLTSTNTNRAVGWCMHMFFDADGATGFSSTITRPLLKVNTPGWYQLAFVKQDRTGTFYLNGQPNGTFTSDRIVSYLANDFSLGRDYRDNARYLNADLASLMIYNHSMTPLEILQNFNDNQSRFLTPLPPLAQTAIFSQLSSTSLSACRAAYAFRLVNPRYTGFCVQVRRASDNTLQNFYADVNGNLTTGPLNTGTNINTFISGTTGFVRTWYDQSGLAQNLTQTTDATQPQIFPATGDDTYLYLLNQRGMAITTNIFASATISNMHAIFSSRNISSSQNFLINFNGNNGATSGPRIFIHCPWGPDNLWYWAPGDGTNTASATAITSLGQRVSVSIYKSNVNNNAGMRLNQGTTYLAGTNAQNVSVAAGLALNGIPTGTAGANHYFYGLYVFATRLSAQDESLIETSLMPFTNQPSTITHQGLVCWLDFSQYQSYPGFGRSIYDISGYGNHFTITGSGFSWNQLGYLTLSAATTYATGPASSAFNIQSDHTVEIVCRPTNTANTIIQLLSTASRMSYVNLPWSDNNIYFDCLNSDSGVNRLNYLATTSTVKHYVFRCRMGSTPNREIIENGTSMVNSGTARTPIGSSTWGGTSTIFAESAGANQWLGNFYYLRIYNRALTDAEITTNYNAARARFGF